MTVIEPRRARRTRSKKLFLAPFASLAVKTKFKVFKKTLHVFTPNQPSKIGQNAPKMFYNTWVLA
jgi:hypothetical protein